MRCAHLDSTPLDAVPAPPDQEGCPECLVGGFRDWVHLRQCLACGNVGCCNSSAGRHAERHGRTDHHPVMRSFEPGESWRWCFVDERLG